MPTLYKAEAYQPAPAWLSIWDYMYSELEGDAVSILQPTGFYDAHDIEVPAIVEGRKIGSEESAAIGRIATALTIAADGAHRTAPGIVSAWLERVTQPHAVAIQAAPARGSLGDCVKLQAPPRGARHPFAGCL